MKLPGLAVFIALATYASSARADWPISIAAQTDIPVMVGVSGQVEGPYRLRASVGLGFLPGAYVSGANEILVPLFESDGYGAPQAALVESALKQSMVLRTNFGWRPFASLGFVFAGGYTFAGLGGDATGAELLEGLTGVTAPDPSDAMQEFSLGTRVHMLQLEVAWEWTLASFLWLKAGLGWAFTVAATSTIDAETPPSTMASQRVLNDLEQASENLLNDYLTSYIHPPYLIFAVGVQL